MKCFIKVLLAAIMMVVVVKVGSVQSVYAEGTENTEKSYENVISANPVGLIFGVANVEWEHKIRPDLSIAPAGLFASYGDWTMYGVGVTAKKYHLPTAPRGLWYGGNVNIAQVSWDGLGSDTNSTTGFGIGGWVGHKWIYQNGFTIEPSAGLQYYSAGDAAISGVGFGLGLQIGMALK